MADASADVTQRHPAAVVRLLTDATTAALEEVLREVSARPEVESLVVLLGADADVDPDRLDQLLPTLGVPVAGAVFPQVLWAGSNEPAGAIVVGLRVALVTRVVERLDEPAADLVDELTRALSGVGLRGSTVLVLVDATVEAPDLFLTSLFEVVGLAATCLGGGAGDLTFQRRPCLLTERGVLSGAAVVAVLPVVGTLGVAHGWEPISDAFQITHSDGRTVHELDDHPAIDVYRSLVGGHLGRELDAEQVLEQVAAFPFGIVRLGGELIVRDPVLPVEQGLWCVGEVPEGAFVRLLTGDPDSLLAAAGRVRSLADSGDAQALRLAFTCISRLLFLGDRFPEERELLVGDDRSVGAATIGEICNPGDRYLELYNKTAVVAELTLPAG